MTHSQTAAAAAALLAAATAAQLVWSCRQHVWIASTAPYKATVSDAVCDGSGMERTWSGLSAPNQNTVEERRHPSYLDPLLALSDDNAV
jgi:hypothetical protein